MSIFSNWGKGKNTDTDPQETSDRAEQAKQEIKEKPTFRESIIVESTSGPENVAKPKVDNPPNNGSDSPDTRKEGNEIGNGIPKEDDDAHVL